MVVQVGLLAHGEVETMTKFFSKTTLYQLVAYFLVGVFEWFVGFYIYHHLGRITGFFAFGVQSMVIGFIAFLLRKYWVFRT